jgi:hypothetical protein
MPLTLMLLVYQFDRIRTIIYSLLHGGDQCQSRARGTRERQLCRTGPNKNNSGKATYFLFGNTTGYPRSLKDLLIILEKITQAGAGHS